MELNSTKLQLTILNRKQCVQAWQARPIALALPKLWKGLPSHRLLEKIEFLENSQMASGFATNSFASGTKRATSDGATAIALCHRYSPANDTQ